MIATALNDIIHVILKFLLESHQQQQTIQTEEAKAVHGEGGDSLRRLHHSGQRQQAVFHVPTMRPHRDHGKKRSKPNRIQDASDERRRDGESRIVCEIRTRYYK